MSELLKVIENNGKQTVNARDLHEALGVGRDFSTWIKDRIEKYGFVEGEDYQKQENLSSPISGNSKARPQIMVNYLLSISVAKEIAIVENNPQGRAIRLYLIKVEEAWNTPEAVMARALQFAQQKLETYQQEIEILKPKAEFFDTVADSKDALQMRDVAGVLNIPGWGRNKLFALLRKRKVLDERNVPYRDYEDRGYFRVIEQRYTDSEGETRISLKTLVYQRGVEYIRRLVQCEMGGAKLELVHQEVTA